MAKAASTRAAGRADKRPSEPDRTRLPEARRHKASRAELLEFYRQMLLIRRFEERAGQLYGLGLIGGFCHLYIGQEAVVFGMQAAIGEGDAVITSYRDHGHMLACGMDPKGV
ncbi:MAG: thiamine pyrophosphate-dependent enzyme, partial [Sphingosinicella sp.]